VQDSQHDDQPGDARQLPSGVIPARGTGDPSSVQSHAPTQLYETFAPDKARVLWDRFEFVYTPKHGSWLNMAEIELNVLTGQCLNRRLDDIDLVRHEVEAWEQYRDNKNAKINWQFTTPDARMKLARLYPTLDG